MLSCRSQETDVGDPRGIKYPSMILYSDDDTSENDIQAGREDKDPFFFPSAILFTQSKLLRVLLKEEQLPFTFNAKRGFSLRHSLLHSPSLSPWIEETHEERERSNFRGQNSDYKISNTSLSVYLWIVSLYHHFSLPLHAARFGENGLLEKKRKGRRTHENRTWASNETRVWISTTDRLLSLSFFLPFVSCPWFCFRRRLSSSLYPSSGCPSLSPSDRPIPFPVDFLAVFQATFHILCNTWPFLFFQSLSLPSLSSLLSLFFDILLLLNFHWSSFMFLLCLCLSLKLLSGQRHPVSL